jgi:predicted metalloprotease
MRMKVLSTMATVLVLAGCSGGPNSTPAEKSGDANQPGESAGITINGDSSSPVNDIAVKAIGDLQKYWGEEYPKLYGKPYEPVEGGFYSVMPSKDVAPPCTEDVSEVAGNAFYCSSKDVVAWDAEGLLPELQSKFGDFVIPIVFAHEWGHAVQC